MKRASLFARSALATASIAAIVMGLAANAQTPAPAPAAGGMGAAPAAPAGAPPVRRDPLAGADLSPKAPVKHNTPADEQKLFQLQPGYTMTPVLSDPQIQQPGQIAFDADGRMYVLELRSYMLDGDAKDELKPISRISRWEDKDGDGVYETGTTFIDNLVFPRFMTPLGNGQLIVKESNSDETDLFTDTDGDGKADKKELFVTGLGRSGNVEHQESHLTWAMDNWMYSTYNMSRVRWTPTGVQKEAIEPNNGAWGVSQDNYGKVWFQGGATGLPSYFQFPILYGNIAYPDQLEKGFNVLHGAPIGTADMQGGMNAVRMPDGAANGASAGAGANVFRGDRLPAELQGDYFYGEVVGRILRRAHPVNVGGMTQLKQVYQDKESEFIRSMDPLFRPVDNKTAPDGTIYVVDMYHGIIQEAEWAQKGTYLRAKIEQYQLDKAINMGRIWRLSYNGMKRDTTKPRMFEETPAQLVTHLTHPNGWWRDTAQQQLVLRQDKSVVPALKTMAASNKNQLARIHAIWTLEGLNSLDAGLVRAFMTDKDPAIRAQGIRVSETLYKAGGDKSFEADYKKLAGDADANVAIQALLTMQYLKVPNTVDTAKTVQAAKQDAGIQLVSNRIITPPKASTVPFAEDNPQVRTAAEMATLEQGAKLFADNCTECHGSDGMGTSDGGGGLMAPALAGNPRVAQGSPEHILRVLMSGLTDPINGKSYAAGVMVPQRQNDDNWIAAVASFVRNSFSNDATMVTPEMVAYVRKAEAARTEPYTDAELSKVQPRILRPADNWKVTASESAPVVIGGTARASDAFGLQGWRTKDAQKAGMWYQVELPQTVALAGIDYQGLVGRLPPPPPVPGQPFVRPVQMSFYPRGYKLEVSTDGQSWKTVKEGKGASMYNSLVFEPVQAKYVRITTTEAASDGAFWGMRYLKLFEKPTA